MFVRLLTLQELLYITTMNSLYKLNQKIKINFYLLD